MFLLEPTSTARRLRRKPRRWAKPPKQYVDDVVAGIQDLWKLMNISNDRFIRTTDDYHELAVQRIFKKLYDQGDIYKSTYKGKYCTPVNPSGPRASWWTANAPTAVRVHDAEEESLLFPAVQVQPAAGGVL